MKARDERIFAILLLLLASFTTVWAFSYNPIARRMPLIVGVFTLLSLAGYFVAEGLGAREARREGENPSQTPGGSRIDLRMLAWLALLLVLIFLFGVVIGPGVFALLFDRFESKGSWISALLFGSLLSVGIWLIFGMALRESLYLGTFGG